MLANEVSRFVSMIEKFEHCLKSFVKLVFVCQTESPDGWANRRWSISMPDRASKSALRTYSKVILTLKMGAGGMEQKTHCLDRQDRSDANHGRGHGKLIAELRLATTRAEWFGL